MENAVVIGTVPIPSTSNAQNDEREEPVFEIRDFTSASEFERLAHRASLVLRKWAAEVANALKDSQPIARTYQFEHEGIKCDLNCHHSLTPISTAEHQQRFATLGAHRLERWFGTRHTAILSLSSVRGGDDIDTARTALSALVIAAVSKSTLLSDSSQERLSCFVVIEGGRWERLLGECRQDTSRIVYCTDRAEFVSDDFRGGPVRAVSLYRSRFMLEPQVPVLVSVRDTFGGKALKERSGYSTSRAQSGANDNVRDPVAALQFEGHGVSACADTVKLQWSLRALSPAAVETARGIQADNENSFAAPVALSDKLRRLLNFQCDAGTLSSVDQWRTLPNDSFADAFSDPAKNADIEKFARSVVSFPFYPDDSDDLGTSMNIGAPRHSMLGRFSEIACQLPSYKAVLALWSLVLHRLREKFEGLDSAVAAVQASTSLHSDSSLGRKARPIHPSFRCERIGVGYCLLQQKLQLLGECFQRKIASSLPLTGRPTSPTCSNSSAPSLLLPRVFTEDTESEWKLALSAMESLDERLSFLGAEFISDASAFKDVNPGAGLCDFLRWRKSLGLDTTVLQDDHSERKSELGVVIDCSLPEDWQNVAWSGAKQMPVALQPPLFDPEFEAEKALHFLESIDSLQFSRHVFRTCLWTGVENLMRSCTAEVTASEYCTRLLEDCCQKLGKADEQAHLLETQTTSVSEDKNALQTVLQCCETLETMSTLPHSILPKLASLSVPINRDGKAIVEALLGHAAVTPRWREVVCALGNAFSPVANALVREYRLDAERQIGKSHCHERISEPATPGSLYIEVGSSHVRLATSHYFSVS